MNEFIVYDNKRQKWMDSDYVAVDGNGVLYYLGNEYEPINKKEFPICKSIGIKDINSKNIYADCSIVKYGIQQWKVIYNVFQMAYELECLSNTSLSNMRLTGAYQNQLEIIDTIQENKLGLIK